MEIKAINSHCSRRRMGFRSLRLVALPVWMLSVITLQAQHGKTVSLWLTTADRTSLLAKQPEPLRFHKPGAMSALTTTRS
jgi:hypothetical protein